jgi:hypothetical protein
VPIVVDGKTGAIAGYAPSIAEGTGPFSGNADIGPARLEMTVRGDWTVEVAFTRERLRRVSGEGRAPSEMIVGNRL